VNSVSVRQDQIEALHSDQRGYSLSWKGEEEDVGFEKVAVVPILRNLSGRSID